MNILLWILQILLAIHTAIGAVWKFSNSEQTVPSLGAIPHEIWLLMIVVELLCSGLLLLPLITKHRAHMAPVAAAIIGAEMLMFTALHLSSGDTNNGPMIYWLVVAVICGFISCGRFVLRRH